jgi:chromosome segregation ATPase
MENYVDGKEYFIKGTARSSEVPGRPVEFVYDSGYGTNCGVLADEPGLLLTAEEVASGVKDAMHTELVKTNAALSNEIGTKNRDIANLERAVEELRVENESFRKQIDEHKKLFEENGKVAMDLATQRDNFKKHLETALKDFAEKDKACTDALSDKADLQKAVEGLNKEIDGYRETILKMSDVIGFLCGTEGGKNG